MFRHMNKRRPYVVARLLKGSPDARPVLKNLGRHLRQEARNNLRSMTSRTHDLRPVKELHLAVDHLINIEVRVSEASYSQSDFGFEEASGLIQKEISATSCLLETRIKDSVDAGEVVVHTLNLLFRAKQQLKMVFGLATDSDPYDPLETPKQLTKAEDLNTDVSQTRKMILSSATLFQLRQALFPAERMMVGAARRSEDGTSIKIEALFDVTGDANAVGVKADPDRLGKALIAMSETGTYFGLWVHSHPGLGAGATHPSGIDVRQHSDWLKDYSPELVSAIIVKDGYLRFWGTSVESGSIAVVVEGEGISLVSPEERVYRTGI